MTIDELDLLARAIHREWTQKPENLSTEAGSLFYNKHKTSIHIYFCSKDTIWPSIGKLEFECKRPSGFFKSKEKKKFDNTIELLCEMLVKKRRLQ